MGTRERPVSAREFEKLLKTLGFSMLPQDGTSHRQWEHPRFNGGYRHVTVSPHNEPFTKTLLKNMRNQAGLSKREFFKYLDDSKAAKAQAKKCQASLG